MAQFTLPKTWVSGEILYAADLNNQFAAVLAGFTPSQIDGASASVSAMQTVVAPFPLGVPSTASNSLGELHRIRYQLNQIIGQTYWYEDPPVSLTGAARSGAVTTNGTDPGLYGFSSKQINVAVTGVTSGGVVAENTISTLVLTKGARPVELGFSTNANEGVSTVTPGISLIMVSTNINPGTYITTFKINLYKQAALIRTISFPAQFVVPPNVTGTGTAVINGGVASAFVGPGGGGGVTNTGPALALSTTVATTNLTLNGLVSATSSCFIPTSIINYLDISAALTGATYDLKYEYTAPLVATGSISLSISMNGIFHAREIL